jgi:hypothetical protein
MMDHERQVGDVNAARGDIRGHDELHALLFEGAHHLVALLLHEISLQNSPPAGRVRINSLKRVIRAGLGAAEDQATAGPSAA